MEQTPLMQQFHHFKGQHPDAILFMRCGDFYEMFYEDARIASKELQIVLTSRNKTSDQPIPMAGIPHHAHEGYAARLLKKGYKIAICDQVEDPKTAKGIVKREVTQVITPGTVTLSTVLNPCKNNFLAALHYQAKRLYLTYLDVSTGESFTTDFSDSRKSCVALVDEILRVRPTELLIHKRILEDNRLKEGLVKQLIEREIRFQRFQKRLSKSTPLFLEWVSGEILNASGLDRRSGARFSFEMLFQTLETCSIQTELQVITSYSVDEKLLMDQNTIRNLELLETLYSNSRQDSLLGTIDRTLTAPGARLLESMLLSPLINQEEIEKRLCKVEALTHNPQILAQLRSLLKGSYDLYRLVNRLLNGYATGRDLIAVKKTLEIIPDFKALLQKLSPQDFVPQQPDLQELTQEIHGAIVDDPPPKITDGGLIRKGFSNELDRCLKLETQSDLLLQQLEEKARQIAGVKSLKVRFNRVHGYYFEVPRSQSSNLPEIFLRRQTLSNCERFTTEELKVMEREILHARETVGKLEYKLFQGLRQKVLSQVREIQNWAGVLAHWDVISAFSDLALEKNWVRPIFSADPELIIVNGRHPVVESKTQAFVPNDLRMHLENDPVHLITGPNMGGKSTYLRQTAILVVLAQMGSFLPAESYQAKIFDRIFTRVGASDDLGAGKSTFMVEMAETAYLLHHATSDSLVLLDEVGRGTATFDGLSIAWAVVEYLLSENRCMTLFATHYHELTQLQTQDSRVRNFSASVLEQQGEVVFLHKIQPRSADQSYGIHVAKLGGMPERLLRRAREILRELESSKATVVGLDQPYKKLCVQGKQPGLSKLPNLPESALIEKLQTIDPENLTPVQALQALIDLKSCLHKDSSYQVSGDLENLEIRD
jgi:DNA mismatch repair protein MutS